MKYSSHHFGDIATGHGGVAGCLTLGEKAAKNSFSALETPRAAFDPSLFSFSRIGTITSSVVCRVGCTLE